MKRTLTAGVACALFVALFALATAAQPALASTLRVASETDYPPFEFVDEATGEHVGFDIDIIKAIAARMNVELEIVPTRWDRIFDGLAAGEYDLIVSSVSITPERQERFDFSNPYFTTGQSVIVRAGDDSVAGLESLSGRVVGAFVDTTSAEAARSIEGVTVREYNSMELVMEALASGAIAAVVADHPYAVNAASSHPDLYRILGEPLVIEPLGIVVRKGDAELLSRINAALEDLMTSGEYQAIYEKWFGSYDAALM